MPASMYSITMVPSWASIAGRPRSQASFNCSRRSRGSPPRNFSNNKSLCDADIGRKDSNYPRYSLGVMPVWDLKNL